MPKTFWNRMDNGHIHGVPAWSIGRLGLFFAIRKSKPNNGYREMKADIHCTSIPYDKA